MFESFSGSNIYIENAKLSGKNAELQSELNSEKSVNQNLRMEMCQLQSEINSERAELISLNDVLEEENKNLHGVIARLCKPMFHYSPPMGEAEKFSKAWMKPILDKAERLSAYPCVLENYKKTNKPCNDCKQYRHCKNSCYEVKKQAVPFFY